MNWVYLAALAVQGFTIYGLTRERSNGWRNWLIGGGVAAGFLLIFLFPSDGRCYTDWDGVSNPEICD